MNALKNLFVGVIFSTHFLGFAAAAETPIKPPHLDLEMSSEELAKKLNQAKTSKVGSFQIAQPLLKVIKMGERNLEWLKLINKHRNIPISLYERGELGGIPIDKPKRYSKRSILKDFDEIKAGLPKVMSVVIFENGEMTKDLPLDLKTYRRHAKLMDRNYQIAARWILLEPYLGWLVQAKREDIRGYYFLARKVDRKSYLDGFPKMNSSEKEQVRSWMLSLCFMNEKNSWSECSKEFDSSTHDLYGMSQKYWTLSERTYRRFFDIPQGIKNPSTKLIGESLISKFITPESIEERNFLKVNIEEEWQKDFIKLHVEFSDSDESRVHVKWIPGATPHVEGLGSNNIVMDANSSLDDWDTQWTIRHEFGHVLGFPDCYLEFYEPEDREIVSYQIDVNDLMCSRKGVYQPRLSEELLRVYSDVTKTRFY